jgi:DNA-binding CsgD family transcriptional regulator
MQTVLILRNKVPSVPSLKLKLKVGTFLLGRSSNCEFVIKHISVSRQHAEISMLNGGIKVVDLDSQNGTFVDDEPVESVHVMCGQRLRFGQVSFVVKEEQDSIDSELSTDWSDNEPSGKLAVENKLSPAQKRVLELVLKGQSEKETAQSLHLSRCTVHNHLQTIYTLLGVHSRTELLARILTSPEMTTRPPNLANPLKSLAKAGATLRKVD